VRRIGFVSACSSKWYFWCCEAGMPEFHTFFDDIQGWNSPLVCCMCYALKLNLAAHSCQDAGTGGWHQRVSLCCADAQAVGALINVVVGGWVVVSSLFCGCRFAQCNPVVEIIISVCREQAVLFTSYVHDPLGFIPGLFGGICGVLQSLGCGVAPSVWGGGTVRTLLPTCTALVVCLPCNLWNAMKVLSWVLTEPIPAAADYRRPAHDHVLAGVFLLSALVTQ
jgi:hypothetical protein